MRPITSAPPRSAEAQLSPTRAIAHAGRAALLLLLLAATASADWVLWPSPFEGREVVDQEQSPGDAHLVVPGEGAGALGQTFVPQRTPLQRLDLLLLNRFDVRPGRLRLWRWRGTREESVAIPPLFEDSVVLAGRNTWQTRSFFPRLEVEPGQTYYFELEAPGRERYLALGHGEDAYAPGTGLLAKRGKEKPLPGDLWFRTFTTGETAAPEPEVRWSEPGRWWPPEPTGQVSREDYRQRVAAAADDQRPRLPFGCGRQPAKALYDAFLYRLSCEEGRCQERHAETVRDALLHAYAHRFCTGGLPPRCTGENACETRPHVPFNWLERPGLAYAWTRRSRSYTATHHAAVEKLFSDSAQRIWADRRGGSHNMSLGAAAGFTLMAQLFPDAPEASRWRDYAQDIWQAFVAQFDTNEDSSSYTAGVTLPAVLLLAELSGRTEELWAQEGFRNLVERLAQQTAPVGVMSPYGDGGGWTMGQGGLIWLFESAAVHTGDPRYRWLARRAFDFVRSRARDDPPAADAFQTQLPYLALAYFAARDRPPGEPPAAQREVAVATALPDPPRVRPLGAGGSIGQSFRAGAAPIARIDLKLASPDAAGAARVRVRGWRGGPGAGSGAATLFDDRVALEAGRQLRQVSLFPLLEVEPGEALYLEVEAEGRTLLVATSTESEDLYPQGQLVEAGERIRGDLWFRVSSLAGTGSVATRRHPATRRVPRAWGHPKVYVDYGPERVPGKLVLRSGPEPDDLLAVVNLLSRYGHGRLSSGSLEGLLDGGSILLSQTAFQKRRSARRVEDESTAVVRRYWGGLYDAPGGSAELEQFVDARHASIAELHWKDAEGWGVEQQRRLLFVKNRLLWVRDRFRFPYQMRAAVGPVWHAGDVRPQRGADWFDVAYREPLGNVWKFRNPERYATLHFVARDGSEVGALREASYDPPPDCGDAGDAGRVEARCANSPPFVLYQRWSGEARPGEIRWFDSLILPHGPELTPAAAAGRIRVVHDDGVALALSLRLGDEHWILLDNPEGRNLELASLGTDASFAALRLEPETRRSMLVLEATHLRWAGGERRWPLPTSVEEGVTYTARLAPGVSPASGRAAP